MTEILRVGNCSGFYGDRLAAAREMVEGGPIDVLSGDYLAELTMTILHNQRQTRGAHMGYVGTFLKQIRDVAATCQERGIKIVSNAGGLNPKGMAEEIEKILTDLGVEGKVAYIDGDDLMGEIEGLQAEGEAFVNMDRGVPLSDSTNQVVTANTYFGGVDVTGHRFRRFTHPDDGGWESTEDQQRVFGPALANYYRWADHAVGQLVQASWIIEVLPAPLGPSRP